MDKETVEIDGQLYERIESNKTMGKRKLFFLSPILTPEEAERRKRECFDQMAPILARSFIEHMKKKKI